MSVAVSLLAPQMSMHASARAKKNRRRQGLFPTFALRGGALASPADLGYTTPNRDVFPPGADRAEEAPQRGTGRTMLPQFVCVGTLRAGTTWLDAMLGQHPRVVLPREKETMFFSNHYDRGLGWYEALFRGGGPDCVAGEICPVYFSHPRALERIRRDLPGVRVLLMLREPLSQIGSIYRLWLARGYRDRPLDELIVSEPCLLDDVRYATRLARCRELFGPQRVGAFFFDDLKADPEGFLTGVQAFLGLEPHVPADVRGAVNAAGRPRSMLLSRALAWGGDTMRRRGLYGLKACIQRTGLVSLLKRGNAGGGRVEVRFGPETLGRVREQIRPEIVELARLTGRDLGAWLERMDSARPS